MDRFAMHRFCVESRKAEKLAFANQVRNHYLVDGSSVVSVNYYVKSPYCPVGVKGFFYAQFFAYITGETIPMLDIQNSKATTKMVNTVVVRISAPIALKIVPADPS